MGQEVLRSLLVVQKEKGAGHGGWSWGPQLNDYFKELILNWNLSRLVFTDLGHE